MGTEIDSIDSMDSDTLFIYANWLQNTGLWDGRHVTLEDAPEFQKEVEDRIAELFFSFDEENREFQELAARLAWLGTSSENQSLLAKDIQALNFTPNRWLLVACSSRSSKHKSGLSKFWKKYKKEILIGLGVLTVVTVVVVVAVCSEAVKKFNLLIVKQLSLRKSG